MIENEQGLRKAYELFHRWRGIAMMRSNVPRPERRHVPRPCSAPGQSRSTSGNSSGGGETASAPQTVRCRL